MIIETQNYRKLPSHPLKFRNVAEIDARITLLRSELLLLREHRNQMASPLCRIPEELLVQILEMGRHQHRFMGSCIVSQQREKDLLLWIRATSICRHVRMVSLGRAALWTSIELDCNSIRSGRAFMALYRQRDFRHPIQMAIDTHNLDAMMVPKILRLAPRTADLHLISINTANAVYISVSDSLRSHFWSRLERLVLVCVQSTPSRRIYEPLQLRELTARGLRKLTLMGLWTLQAFPALPQLQDLAISEMNWDDDHQRLNDYLLNVPNLTYLKLQLGAHETPTQSIPRTSYHLIHLETLRKLELESADGTPLQGVLAMVSFPHGFLSIINHSDHHDQPVQSTSSVKKIVEKALAHARQTATNAKFEYHLSFPQERYDDPRLVWFQLIHRLHSRESQAQGDASVLQFLGPCSIEDFPRFIRLATFLYPPATVSWDGFARPSLLQQRQVHYRKKLLLIIEKGLIARKLHDEHSPMHLVVSEQDNYDVDTVITYNQWLEDGLVDELVHERIFKAPPMLSGARSRQNYE